MEQPDAYCTIATIDSDGYPKASTITASRSGGIEWVTFCTGFGSGKTKRIEKCNRASVCFNTDGAYNISLIGTLEIVTDPEVKREMWYEGLTQHFSGPDDPNYCVLRFQTERYSLLIDWKEAEGSIEPHC